MYFEFDNLTEAYLGLHEKILSGEIPHSVEENTNAVIPSTYIKVFSPSMRITLDKLGYTDRKMAHLERNYMDYSGWDEFFDGLEGVKGGRELTYRFKQKEPYKGKPRDNCLITLSYQKAFNNFSAVWRSTELGARWGADLILLNKLLSPFKGGSFTLSLVILHGYQELMVFPGICEMVGIPYRLKGMEAKYKKAFKFAKDKYYSEELTLENLYTKWRPITLVQRNLIKFRGM